MGGPAVGLVEHQSRSHRGRQRRHVSATIFATGFSGFQGTENNPTQLLIEKLDEHLKTHNLAVVGTCVLPVAAKQVSHWQDETLRPLLEAMPHSENIILVSLATCHRATPFPTLLLPGRPPCQSSGGHPCVILCHDVATGCALCSCTWDWRRRRTASS